MRIDAIADETHIMTWKECRRNSIDRAASLKRQASIRASVLYTMLQGSACVKDVRAKVSYNTDFFHSFPTVR